MKIGLSAMVLLCVGCASTHKDVGMVVGASDLYRRRYDDWNWTCIAVDSDGIRWKSRSQY